jgi:hypothetical protein
LFIIYVNDILSASPNDTIGLYADDTTCVTGANNPTENIQSAKDALINLGNWFASNGLSLSPTKCKFGLINKSLTTSEQPTSLSIYGQKLSEIRVNTSSTNSPLVGYLFTENLSPKSHLDYIIGKTRAGILAIKKNKFLPNEVTKSIYYATIHSHITYAGIIMGCVNKSDIKPLAKMQKVAIRLIDRAPYNAPTNPIFKKHNILQLADLLDLQAASYAWKFLHGKLPSSIAAMMSISGARTMMIKGERYTLQKIKN